MKVLICGDRKWGAYSPQFPNPTGNHAKLMYKAMKVLGPDDVVIEGEAAGADILSRIICELRDIPFIPVPADWCDFNSAPSMTAAGPITTCTKRHNHLGKRAGMERNKLMISKQPDEVWAFHDDLTQSKGTISTVRLAWRAGIPVKWFSPKTPSGAVLPPQADISTIGGRAVWTCPEDPQGHNSRDGIHCEACGVVL